MASGGVGSSAVRVTNDPQAPAVRLEEKSALEKFSLDYFSLSKQLKKRYSNFMVNTKYHNLRAQLSTKGYSWTRKLNPNSPSSAKQDFYDPAIIHEFDKHYTLK